MKEDGKEGSSGCFIPEVKLASLGFVVVVTSSSVSAEALTLRLLLFEDTSLVLFSTEGASFLFARRSVVFADFGMEDMVSEGPEIGVRGSGGC